MTHKMTIITIYYHVVIQCWCNNRSPLSVCVSGMASSQSALSIFSEFPSPFGILKLVGSIWGTRWSLSCWRDSDKKHKDQLTTLRKAMQIAVIDKTCVSLKGGTNDEHED
jgi:hypothetical protein